MLHHLFIFLLSSHCTIISLEPGKSSDLDDSLLFFYYDYVHYVQPLQHLGVYKCLPDLFRNQYTKEPSNSLSESGLRGC